MTEMIPEVMPEVSSEPPVLEDDKKLKKLEQLRAARESKKKRKLEKEAEDAKIREALLRLTEENENLKRKREPEPLPPPTPTPEVEEEPEQQQPAKRTRVTREKEEDLDVDDDDVQQQPTGTSFAQQALITGIVGTLGLASWYTQNRLFQEPAPKPPATKKKIPQAQAPKKMSQQQKPIVQKSPTKKRRPLFVKKVVKPVGSSGFTI